MTAIRTEMVKAEVMQAFELLLLVYLVHAFKQPKFDPESALLRSTPSISLQQPATPWTDLLGPHPNTSTLVDC